MKKKVLFALVSGLIISAGAFAQAEETTKNPLAAESRKKLKQTTCPVLGGKINKKLFYDYKGQRIYVCCHGCINEIKKNPEKYLKKMRKTGVVPEKLNKKEHLHS